MSRIGWWKTADNQVLPAIESEAGWRVLAALDPGLRAHALPPRFSDFVEVIPRSEWREYDRTLRGIPIRDQKQQGSCVGFGSWAAFYRSYIKSGQAPIDLSPWFLYSLINGGIDRGAVVSDAMAALKDDGISPTAYAPEGRIHRRNHSAESFAQAKRFRVESAYTISSFDELVTADILGYDAVFGIGVGNGFTRFDDEWVPQVEKGAWGGHAMATADALKRSKRYSWRLRIQNSWGTQFGWNGYCYLSQPHFEGRYGVQAYAIRVVRRDPEQDSKTPPAISSR